MQEPISIRDFEEYGEKNLPKYAYEYYNLGAEEGFSARENCQAFKRLRIRPLILKGITTVDTSTTILGIPVPSPICIAPTASHRLAHPDREIATVKAAAEHGIIMILSLSASSRLHEISSAAEGNSLFLQMLLFRDRNTTLAVIDRVEKEGFKAIVLTVDRPTPGYRRHDVRNNFAEKRNLRFDDYFLKDFLPPSGTLKTTEEFYEHMFSIYESSISWEDIDWLRSKTKLPILLKGILTGTDAAEAVKHGVSGIIVSNHGGRQLDGVPATIEALPEVVKAVNGRCEVFVDGGIRCGTDILKALVLGARAVFVGRPIIWGLAYKGQEGVKKVLQIFSDELERAMILSGCNSIHNLRPSLVVHESYYRDMVSTIATTQ